MSRFQHQVWTLPNLLTGARFLLTGIFVLLLSIGNSLGFTLGAFAFFIIAAVSDWVDGYVARRYMSESVLGKLMDPLADKVLVAAGLIMLIPSGLVPAWIALLILSREFIVTGLRALASSAGIVVAASKSGKVKSTTQYVALGILLFPDGLLPLPFSLHGLGALVLYAALLLTIWSGLDYFLKLRHLFIDPPETVR